MTRFTLPLLPIALAAVFAGVATLWGRDLKIARIAAVAIVAVYFGVGCAGMLVYSRPALEAASGVVSRDEYLRARAPDFYRTQFLDESLSHITGGGKVWVGFAHTYYLQPPFVNGASSENLLLDPRIVRNAGDLEALLRRENVRWFLLADGPTTYATSLFAQLREHGTLTVCAEGIGHDFASNRTNDSRASQQLTLLCLMQNSIAH